ncbi:unnamed protein product [Cuscuta campestris]|uniref:Ubiquitin-like protease family profile domain-containing protein n=1 Tax=Cuscuta campestris TaxID=132261 RepID=A0A484LQ21_9ASTE|nr:unnamed protein product [Cuscuta campestris]
MENTGASSGFEYKRRRILTQTQREEMENENQISAEVTPSVEGQSFLDASEIKVPALACTIDIDKIPGMKLTLKSSLGEFQNLMGEGLGDHPEVLDLFRESTPFSHFLDVESDGRKKKKADELLSKPPTKADLLEFKSFIVKAIKDDRPVQCYLAQYKEIQDFVKTFWTDLITPGFWVGDTHLSEYLYVLRRRLCNDDGDSCIAPFEFNNYVNSYEHDPEWPVLSGSLEKIVDGTYSEGPEAFKTKSWKKNTKYVYYLKGTSSHWFCIKADFERCRLVVLDSLKRITSIETMASLLIDDLRGFKGIAGIREIGKHGYADWEIEYCTVPQQIDCDCGIFAVKIGVEWRMVDSVLFPCGKHEIMQKMPWSIFCSNG